MLKNRQIIVVGAGVAGLATATLLARAGARVRVLEQASQLGEVGAGLQISPNGVAVLQALGLNDRVLQNGLQSRAVELRNFSDAKKVLQLDLTGNRWGRPFILIHRASLIAALADAAEQSGVMVEFNQNVDVRNLEADLIVGADGIRSATRTELNGPEQAQFTNQVAWRAIVADEAAPIAQVFMGPGRHLVSYPIGQGKRNIVAVEERDEWAEESWDYSDDPENLRAAFADFAPAVQDWLADIGDVKLWGLFRHPVAACWQDGGRALVGDAAHPTLPFLAQGANLALEDAYVLAHCLTVAKQDAALGRYQEMRQARVTRAIAAANANARNYHLRHTLLRFGAHNILRLGSFLAPNAPLRRFDWLYGHDVTA